MNILVALMLARTAAADPAAVPAVTYTVSSPLGTDGEAACVALRKALHDASAALGACFVTDRDPVSFRSVLKKSGTLQKVEGQTGPEATRTCVASVFGSVTVTDPLPWNTPLEIGIAPAE